ncbi:MAG: penicillin-binding transpeptidase domain-containing protein [Peptostreptococcaceae bacterium]
MRKLLKRLLVASTILIMSALTLTACSQQNKIEECVNNYTKLLNEKNYDNLYNYLSKSSKEYITKDEFVERYQKIYSAIGAKNFDVEMPQDYDKTNALSYSMETNAGKLKFDNVKVNIVKEDGEYKIEWNESLILGPMTKDDKVRVETIKATRGSILDRDSNKLAYDGEVNSVGIHPKVFDTNREENLIKMAEILDISKEYIEGKLDANSNPEHLVPIVKVSIYDQEKADLVGEIEGVKVSKTSSRVYAKGEAFGSLIGYIDEIKADELEKYQDKGYNSTSKIGKKGLEQQYEDTLRAKDGAHIYLERGEEKITIAKTEPVNGKDITLAIDSELQVDIYNQMNYEKGASIAMDPKTGEILAMVSSPSYDSNTYVTYKTKSIASKWEENNNSQSENRANDAYSPGSTMKLITAAIGLQNGAIDPNKAVDIKGTTWQKDTTWGKYYVTRVKDPNKSVNLYDATKYSDNIYYAQSALNTGEEAFIEGAKQFGIGEEIPFEFPMGTSQISNSGKLDKEILLADTGYGQGEVLMTPLNITMAYSALANDGKIMAPRLVTSENSEAKVYKQAIDSKYINELTTAFSGVINDDDGSGTAAKIDGVNIAGKTGTAEIKQSKDDTEGSENGWFAAVDIHSSKLAISMLVEDLNGKSTGQYVVPMVGNVMKNYVNR